MFTLARHIRKLAVISFGLIVFTILSCREGGKDLGTRYEIGVAGQKFPADLYYTAGVSEGIMYELAAYLVVTDFYKENYWSVQVNKNGEVYEFKWAARVNDKLDPTAHREAIKAFSTKLSKWVFKGARVDIHYCTDNFNTRRIFKGDTVNVLRDHGALTRN